MTDAAVHPVAAAEVRANLPHRAELAAARTRLAAYFTHLGLRDAAHIDTLVEECLRRASAKVAPGSREELVRRALEEAHRSVEKVVADILGLNAHHDPQTIAGAHAALLLGGAGKLNVDRVFAGDNTSELARRLRLVMPQAVPPEAHLSMHEQPISFFFSDPQQPEAHAP